MKNNQLTPEQLAEQIVANSAALIQADLKLKTVSQRSNKLMQQAPKSVATSRRDGRIFWLLLVAASVLLSYAGYLFYSF